jgi:hypothetical protein
MNTPELDKMEAVQEQSQTIGEFLEWLNGKGISLCKLGTADWEQNFHFPIHDSTEKLLAEYFDIDLNKVEQEKQVLLAEWRNQ